MIQELSYIGIASPRFEDWRAYGTAQLGAKMADDGPDGAVRLAVDDVDYRIAIEDGPPHDRSFVAVAEVGGEEIGRGEGKTKKAAEQEAAARALDTLVPPDDDDDGDGD